MNELLALLASADFLPAANTVAIAVTAVVGFLMHRKCEDTRERVVQLESEAPPSADQILELYNTADKTLQALNKFSRARGRSIQAEASVISSRADEAAAATNVQKRPLVGGGSSTGGLIRKR